MRSVRGAGRIALARIRSSPWLLLVGVVSTLATAAAVFSAVALTGPPSDYDVLGPTVHLVVVGALAAVLRALLLAVPTAGLVSALGAAEQRRSVRDAVLDGWGRRSVEALLSVVLAVLLGTGIAAVAFLPALAVYAPLATGAQAIGYVLGYGLETLTFVGVLGLLVPVTAACAVAAGSVGLATPVVGAGRARPGSAIREAARTVISSPRSVVGHGVVVVGLLLSPILMTLGVALAFSELGLEGSTEALVLAAIGLVVAILAYTLCPVYRAVAAGAVGADSERASEGTTVGADPNIPGERPEEAAGRRPEGIPGRTLLIVLAVSAVVVGATGAVRVADVAPEPSGSPPGPPMDRPPDAVVEAGIEALSSEERVVVRSVYRRESANASRTLSSEQVVRFDPDDREALVAFFAHDADAEEGEPAWSLRGTYTAETVELTRLEPIESASRGTLADVREAEGRWYGKVGLRTDYAPSEAGSDAWPWLDDVPTGTFEVVESESTEDRIVLRTRSVDAYRDLRELDPERVVGGYVSVVVDAETGYPLRVVSHRVAVDRSGDDSPTRRVRHVVARIERRPVDVTRPPGAPSKGLLETVFDALVY